MSTRRSKKVAISAIKAKVIVAGGKLLSAEEARARMLATQAKRMSAYRSAFQRDDADDGAWAQGRMAGR